MKKCVTHLSVGVNVCLLTPSHFGAVFSPLPCNLMLLCRPQPVSDNVRYLLSGTLNISLYVLPLILSSS